MSQQKQATLYRMAGMEHLCPFGLKCHHLLRRHGYSIDDRKLTDREQVEAVKQELDVSTTPQVIIDDRRIGGYEELREYLGIPLKEKGATTYRPVVVLFIMAAFMALAATLAPEPDSVGLRLLQWFIAFSMCLLAYLKLRDVESFSSMFLNYDLLAQRWVPYAYVYPYGEGFAGVLMIAGGMAGVIAAPVAIFIGAVGGWSVFKAVYIDRRELKCACVGGDSSVPLGFISLTENLMMLAMGLWMLIRWA